MSARRRSPTKATRNRGIKVSASSSTAGGLFDQAGKVGTGQPLDVLAVLGDAAQGPHQRPLVQLLAAQSSEGTCPIDALRHTGRLVEVQPANGVHGCSDLARQ